MQNRLIDIPLQSEKEPRNELSLMKGAVSHSDIWMDEQLLDFL